MEFFVKRLSQYFREREIISENQIDWCEYVLARYIHTITLLPLMIIIGCFFAPLMDVIILNWGVYYLRNQANGFHAKTFWGCVTFSIFCEILALLLLVNLHFEILVILFVLSGLFILWVAPINNKRVHFDELEMESLRKGIRKRIAIYSVISFAVLLIVPKYFGGFALASVVVASLLLISKMGFGIQ